MIIPIHASLWLLPLYCARAHKHRGALTPIASDALETIIKVFTAKKTSRENPQPTLNA